MMIFGVEVSRSSRFVSVIASALMSTLQLSESEVLCPSFPTEAVFTGYS